MDAPLPPRRPPQAELNQLGQARAQPAVSNEGPMDLLGGIESLGPEIGKFLEGLFGQAFGGTPSYPGYQWDGLEGWIPDGAGGKPAAAPAPVAPTGGTPASIGPGMMDPKPMGPATGFK